MSTYRVIEVVHDARGAISDLVVKTDTGKKLKNKETLTKGTVLSHINHYGDVFYKIDLKTGMTRSVRNDPQKFGTIRDQDLADNLD